MARETRREQMNDSLNHVHMIVFLLSPDSLAEGFCMALMEWALKGQAHVTLLFLLALLNHYGCFQQTEQQACFCL